MSDVGIFGASGFSREVRDIVVELGKRPIFIAQDQAELDSFSFQDDIILESEIGRYRNLIFAIGIGDNIVREKVATRYSGSLRFANLIHPSASFGHGQRGRIEKSQGVVICAGVRFTNNIEVGDFSIFNLNTTVGHDVIIERFCNTAPGANISGNVHLGTRCWVGTGAAINQGSSESRLKIGHDTVIGSGSVVLKSCDSNAVYAGVPAKRLK